MRFDKDEFKLIFLAAVYFVLTEPIQIALLYWGGFADKLTPTTAAILMMLQYVGVYLAMKKGKEMREEKEDHEWIDKKFGNKR